MAALLLEPAAFAAPTLRLTNLFPPAGAPGGSVAVTCTGTGFDQATGMHFSMAGISAKVVHATPESATFEVAVSPGASPGICDARIITKSGISNPRAFCVSRSMKEEVAAGNQAPDRAVRLDENMGISAYCTAEASAYYSIELAPGQQIRLECLTSEIDSKMLPVILLSDDRGREVARSRRGGRLDFSAPHDGRYTVEIHDLLYRGGSDYFYHLGYTDAPEHTVNRPQTSAHSGIQSIVPPCEITSCFANPGIFEFAAHEGDFYWVEIASNRLGNDTAPDVLLQSIRTDKSGQHVQDLREINGIDGPADVRVPQGLTLTRDVAFPLDIKQAGTYRLFVRDLLAADRDGEPSVYRLSIRRPKPDFELLALEAPAFDDAERKLRSASKGILLQNGGCIPIHLVLRRKDGFQDEVRVEAQGLPHGMSASTVIPAGQNQGVLMIQSVFGQPAWAGTIQVMGRGTDGKNDCVHEAQYQTVVWPATAEQPAAMRIARDYGIARGLEMEPLTIEPGAGAALKVKADRNLHLPLLLTSHAQIKPSVSLRVAGLEELADLPVLTLNPTQRDPALDLNTARKLAPGTHTIYLEATVTVHSGTTDSAETVYSRPIRFEVTAG